MSEIPSTQAVASLQDRASAALLRFASLNQKERDQAERSAIETARSRAETYLGILNGALRAADGLSQLGVALSPLDSRTRGLAANSRRALRTAVAAFVDPDASLTNRLTGKSVQKALKEAEDVGRALVRALNKAVDTERLRLCPPDLSEAIPDIPNMNAAQLKLVRAREQIEKPVEGEDPDDLVGLVQRLRSNVETWQQLRPQLRAIVADLPPAIRQFVEEASTEEGVPWTELKTEVRDWLDSDSHGEAYRVRR